MILHDESPLTVARMVCWFYWNLYVESPYTSQLLVLNDNSLNLHDLMAFAYCGQAFRTDMHAVLANDPTSQAGADRLHVHLQLFVAADKYDIPQLLHDSLHWAFICAGRDFDALWNIAKFIDHAPISIRRVILARFVHHLVTHWNALNEDSRFWEIRFKHLGIQTYYSQATKWITLGFSNAPWGFCVEIVANESNRYKHRKKFDLGSKADIPKSEVFTDEDFLKELKEDLRDIRKAETRILPEPAEEWERLGIKVRKFQEVFTGPERQKLPDDAWAGVAAAAVAPDGSHLVKQPELLDGLNMDDLNMDDLAEDLGAEEGCRTQ